MEKTFAKIGIYLTLFLIVSITSGILGAVLYNRLFISSKNKDEAAVTSHTIVDKISNKGILITKSVNSEESVTISVNNNSTWDSIWWGHEIEASSMVRTDLGVDLSKVTESDIEIDEENKIVYIKLPDVEINTVSLDGPIEVETTSGILKAVLDSDTDEDYNTAIDEIKKQAKTNAESNTELLEETKTSVIDILNVIISDTGYRFIEKIPNEN